MLNPAFADSIAKIESGGRYGILGPITKSGDRAYGKYQVMGSNIPVWTKEILGAPMSPEEFLNNPQAQDAVFQGKFGQYVEKYGPEGAAQAWFAGPGGVGKLDRKDQLGTSVEAYGQKFMAGLGSGGGAINASPTVSGPQIEGNKMEFLTALMSALGGGTAASLGSNVAQGAGASAGASSPFSNFMTSLNGVGQGQMPTLGLGQQQPQQSQQQQPWQSDAPTLGAPMPPQMMQALNIARAFQNIPTPAGFRGFSLRG